MKKTLTIIVILLSFQVMAQGHLYSCSDQDEVSKLEFLKKQIQKAKRDSNYIGLQMETIAKDNIKGKPNAFAFGERAYELTAVDASEVDAISLVAFRFDDVNYSQKKLDEVIEAFKYVDSQIVWAESSHMDSSVVDAVGEMIFGLSFAAHHQIHYFIVEQRLDYSLLKEEVLAAIHNYILKECHIAESRQVGHNRDNSNQNQPQGTYTSTLYTVDQ